MFTSRPWKIPEDTFPRRNNKITILQRPARNILISLNNGCDTFVYFFQRELNSSAVVLCLYLFINFFEGENSDIAKMGETRKLLFVLFIFIGLFHTLFPGLVLTERTTIGSAFSLYAKIYNAYTL